VVIAAKAVAVIAHTDLIKKPAPTKNKKWTFNYSNIESKFTNPIIGLIFVIPRFQLFEI
jgi:hypothetical protein